MLSSHPPISQTPPKSAFTKVLPKLVKKASEEQDSPLKGATANQLQSFLFSSTFTVNEIEQYLTDVINKKVGQFEVRTLQNLSGYPAFIQLICYLLLDSLRNTVCAEQSQIQHQEAIYLAAQENPLQIVLSEGVWRQLV